MCDKEGNVLYDANSGGKFRDNQLIEWKLIMEVMIIILLLIVSSADLCSEVRTL